jgi:serine/threonine protein kinase/tetratricopeptide (TPR) repeat protein
MPDNERERRLEELYSGALQRDASERDEFLRQACGGDAELRRAVEWLLGSEQKLDGFLEPPPLQTVTEGAAITQERPLAGQMLGLYRLIQPVGSGGMGEVWLAEQKQPVRRRVAIKLIKAGMDTREVVARFESERRAVALMDHATIAKVFDAGSTPEGRPYFVMEYVPGIPITDWCDKHKLAVRERLELFIHVCEGVNHAHQKAIIHRDLKPSNILVTEVDGKPAPKIIDFGVAKAVSQRLTEDTLVTRLGAVLGTLEYMSPEQACSAGEDIDTRTDVYSLGVILYELLVGRVPLELRKLAFDEMLRKLRQEDAPRPSTKLRSLGGQSAIVAQNHSTEPRALGRQLRGDLDLIALKALEKQRARRYGAPSELAADIRHYLGDEPVTARPASTRYRAWKYVRRHRLGVAFAAGLAFLLVAGIVVSSWMALRASRAEDEAKAVNDFLRHDVLAQASVDGQATWDSLAAPRRASAKPDPDMKVRTALDRAAARIEGKFGRQPLVEAAIRYTIGVSYYELGLYPQAQRELELALDLRRRILGVEHPATLWTLRYLAVIYLDEGRLKDAEKLNGEAIQAQRRVLGAEDPATLASKSDQANIYSREGKYAEAEALYRELLTVQRRRLGEDHRETLQVRHNLGSNYIREGKYAQAEPIQRDLVDAMLRVNGEDDFETLAGMGNLAMIYGFEDKFAESEALYGKVVDGLRRVKGNEHPLTLQFMEGLAWDYDQLGKYAQADALYSKVFEAQSRVLGKEHPDFLITVTDMGASYRRRGMYPQAEALFFMALQGRRHTLGGGHPDTLASIGDLGSVYVSEGRYAEAEPLLREAANRFEKAASDDWERYRVECALGMSLAGQKQYGQAEPLLVDGYQKMMERKAPIPADGRFELAQAGEGIVRLYQNWGKPEKANEWRQKLKESGLPGPNTGKAAR